MVQIAAITAADHDDWLLLWKGYLDFYAAEVNPETTALTFERLSRSTPPFHGAIARDRSGRAIGIAHWLTHPSTWTASDSCYLEDLFVAPESRGQGVGLALIEHVRAWAKQSGCARLYWFTAETNTVARGLYDRVASRSGMIEYQILF